MNRIVPAQAMAGGQLNRLIHDRPANRGQDIFLARIGHQIGASVAVLSGGCVRPHFASKGRGNLDQTDFRHSDHLRWIITPRLHPGCAVSTR